MMHLNPENNFYVTLGLSSLSSQDQIRERWKRLMLLYHPDRQGEDKEWFAERAKKVNEAYSVLKNAADRAAFDGKLAKDSQRLQSSRLRGMVRDGGVPHRAARVGSVPGKSWALRRYVPVLIVACYVLAAAVFLAFIYFRDDSTSLESALRPAGHPAISRLLQEVPPSAAEQAGDPDRLLSGQGSRGEGLKAVPGDAAGTGLPSGPEAAPPVRKRPAADTPPAASEEAGPAVASARQTLPGIPAETAPAVPPRGNSGEGMKAQPPAVHAITKAEVEDFLRRYAESYRNGRIEEFMKFFSRRAVENGRMDHEMIRSSYGKTFSAGIAAYRLEDIDMKIEGSKARVSGVYNVGRYAAAGEPARNRRGKIAWTLVKEDDALKILEARYDD